jgi:hypothetical protein
MTKKKLDTTGISQDLEGVVSLFAKQDRQPAATQNPVPSTEEKSTSSLRDRKRPARNEAAKKSSNRDTKQPRHHETKQLSNHDAKQPIDQAEMVETIRSAVKQLGEKAATYRFTAGEKKALADIVYTYKSAGLKTSENEITRIAVNYLIEDYRRNGQMSLLATVLERLKS